MSLLDDLRELGDAIDPSLLPSTNEIQKVLGALVSWTEHGDKVIEAAAKGSEDVSTLLTDEQGKVATASAAATPAPSDTAAADATTVAALQAEISDLQAQIATRDATDKQTQVVHEQGADPSVVGTPAEPAPAVQSDKPQVI